MTTNLHNKEMRVKKKVVYHREEISRGVRTSRKMRVNSSAQLRWIWFLLETLRLKTFFLFSCIYNKHDWEGVRILAWHTHTFTSGRESPKCRPVNHETEYKLDDAGTCVLLLLLLAKGFFLRFFFCAISTARRTNLGCTFIGFEDRQKGP